MLHCDVWYTNQRRSFREKCFLAPLHFLHGRWRLLSICHINRHVFFNTMFFSIILLTFLQILHSKIPSPGKLVKTRHIWRHDLQTESTGSRRSELIGDSCSRQLDVRRVELSCVGVATETSPTQLNSSRRRVELSCVAINGPLVNLVYHNHHGRPRRREEKRTEFNCTQR